MRKSKMRSKVRLATASGLTTGTVAAALLVAPTAALAATTVFPATAAAGANFTIFDDAATFPATTTGRIQVLLSGTTCAATIATTTATIVSATTVSSTGTSITFTAPVGAVADTYGKAKRYIACTYGATGNDARIGAVGGYPFHIGTMPVVTPPGGLTGGGGMISVSAGTAVFTGAPTIGARFSTEPCPATYGTPATGTFSAVTKLSDSAVSLPVPPGVTAPNPSVKPTAYDVCLYGGNASTAPLITAGSYYASQLNLSQNAGPYGGGNGLNLTSTTAFLAGVDAPGVSFSNTACTAKYESTTTANTMVNAVTANIRKVNNNRLAVTVPSLRSTAPASLATWNVCVYSGEVDNSDSSGGSDLVISGAYGVTTVPTSAGISPRAGSALGNQRIVVSGTNFPTAAGSISATLGGTPLRDINPLTSTAFEAITPAHTPANNVALVVNTVAGSNTLSNAYSYTAALQAIPNTAPSNRTVDVIVNGIGFESANFNAGGLVAGAHFYLVDGTYVSSEGTASSGNRANPPVADCTNVLVLGDSEAICTLNLKERLDAAGTAVLDPANPHATTGLASLAAGLPTSSTVIGSRVLRNSADVFTEEHIGLMVLEATPTNLPAGTTVVDVISPRIAVLSANAVVGGALTAALVPPAAKQVTISNVTGTNTTVTAASGTFAAGDATAFIVGPNITPGTTISTVTDSATITVSATTTGVNAGATAWVIPATNRVPVPEGAYNLTYVSNGALGAVANDPNYIQSSVSSGSTFTVSSF
jgi:hypothetical protein